MVRNPYEEMILYWEECEIAAVIVGLMKLYEETGDKNYALRANDIMKAVEECYQ